MTSWRLDKEREIFRDENEVIFHLGMAREMTRRESDEITLNSKWIMESEDPDIAVQEDMATVRRIVKLLQ